MDNDNTLFVCQFNDGYSFRNEIEYLKSTNTDGNLVFTRTSITYAKSNGSHTLLNRLRIRTEDINYFFNTNLVKQLIYGFSLSEFARITKGIGKRDGFKIYMTKDDPRACCVLLSHNAQVSAQQNVSYLTPKEVPVEDYEVPREFINRIEPNCAPPISEFCRSCSALNTAKCLHVRLVCYKDGLILDGLDASGKTVKKYGFGGPQIIVDPLIKKDPDKEQIPIVTHIVHVSTIKAISRMTNISPQSSPIKIYFEPDCPILISVKVGVYAEHETYLRSEVEDITVS